MRIFGACSTLLSLLLLLCSVAATKFDPKSEMFKKCEDSNVYCLIRVDCLVKYEGYKKDIKDTDMHHTLSTPKLKPDCYYGVQITRTSGTEWKIMLIWDQGSAPIMTWGAIPNDVHLAASATKRPSLAAKLERQSEASDRYVASVFSLSTDRPSMVDALGLSREVSLLTVKGGSKIVVVKGELKHLPEYGSCLLSLFPQACAKKRVSCTGNDGCSEFRRPVLDLKCSSFGWRDVNEKGWLMQHDTEAQVERSVKVACKNSCDRSLRSLIRVKENIAERELYCENPMQHLVINKGRDNSKKINKEIHTADKIKCDEQPIMKSRNKIVCDQPTTVLYDDLYKLYHKAQIWCQIRAFQFDKSDREISDIPRTDLRAKIKVGCVSKCDSSFITWATGTKDNTNSKFIEPTETGKPIKDAMQGAQLLYTNNAMRSAKPITCDPLVGWKTTDKILIDFTKNKYAVTVDCVNACDQRLENDCIPDRKYCHYTTPINTMNPYKCPQTHLMRIDGKEMPNEVLTCSRSGIAKSDGKIQFITDPSAYDKKFKVECVTKCHPDFIKVTPDNEKVYNYNANDASATVACNRATDVLVMNGNRAFGELKCGSDGWKFGAVVFAPFKTTVHVEATCTKVCDASLINDACKGGDSCTKSAILRSSTTPARVAIDSCTKIDSFKATNPLRCKAGDDAIVSLYFNDKKTTGDVTCTREGWFETMAGVPSKLVDFKGPSVNLPQTVRVDCKRLCHKSLIDDACKDDKCLKLDNFVPMEPIKCGLGADAAVTLYFNDKETTGEIKCTREGWIETTAGVPKTLVDFKAAAVTLPQIVRVDCKRLCDASLIENACTDPAKCAKFSYGASKLSCENGIYALFLNDKNTIGAVTCTKEGWIEEGITEKLVDFTNIPGKAKSLPLRVRAECVQICHSSLIEDTCTDEYKNACKKIKTYQDGQPVNCDSLTTHRLFVNGKEMTDSAECTRQGWKHLPQIGATPTFLDDLDFRSLQRASLPQKVTVECRHRCDERFIVDSCSDGSCTKAQYNAASGVLTCNNPTEIIVLENNGKWFEVFEDSIICAKETGWSSGSGVIIEHLAETKFTVNVKCVQVCHESTLTVNDNTKSRHYTMGASLTCNATNEMLVYSDAVCSREGWKKTKDNTMIQPFMPIPMSVTPHKCTARDFEQFCTADEKDFCEKPNMHSIKYKMFCTPPMELKGNDQSKYYSVLYCDGGAWKSDVRRSPSPHFPHSLVHPTDERAISVFSADEKINVKCSAHKCTGCKDTLNKRTKCTDSNCKAIEFNPPKASYCTGYKCPNGYAYAVAEGSAVYYFLFKKDDNGGAKEDNWRIKCAGGTEYKTPDETRSIAAGTEVWCVRQIPCTETSPLRLDCPTESKCEENLLAKMQSSEKRGENENTKKVECAAGNHMYKPGNFQLLAKMQSSEKRGENENTKKVECAAGNHMYREVSTASPPWEKVASIQCNPAGNWLLPSGSELKKNERVVCTDTLLDATLCKFCRMSMKKKRCDECREKEDDFTVRDHERYCAGTSSTGITIFGDGETTYEPLKCTKEGNDYVWKTAQGRKVGEFAAKRGSPPPKIEVWIIVCIVVGVLLAMALIGGTIGFVRYRRKQQAIAAERLKSKGLSQKIDSIIDEVSVTDDIKTLAL